MLFLRRPAHGFRLILLVLVSIFLMTFDHRANYFDEARGMLSVAVAPLQYAVDLPLSLIHSVQMGIIRKEKLIRENAHLHAERLLLKAQVQKFIALEKENRRLRALLKSKPRIGGRVVAARLLAVETSRFNHKIVLDKGERDGVYVGQPVLDADGVLGQVIMVGPITSHVLMLTDSKSAIPVQINHSGVRSIAKGGGSFSKLELVNIPKTTEINVGDVLVTSGLGLRFPEGYPVGIVSLVENRPGEQFTYIEISPSARLNRSRIVLLVWPDKAEEELHRALLLESVSTPSEE